MTLPLAGRAAMIAGASDGPGRALAEAFLRAGCSVALCARDGAAIDQVAADLARLASEHGARILATASDVGESIDAMRFRLTAIARFPQLDLLVHAQPLADADATAVLCREVLPHLQARGGGAILIVGDPAALADLCETLVTEAATPAIAVQCIAPDGAAQAIAVAAQHAAPPLPA